MSDKQHALTEFYNLRKGNIPKSCKPKSSDELFLPNFKIDTIDDSSID